MKRAIRRGAFVAGLIGGVSGALAHPHVFTDVQAGFLFGDAGRLEALRIVWTYDEFTSLSLFEILDLDKDGDGNLDDTDRAAIVKGETVWPPDYNGDVYLEAGGQPVNLTRPIRASALFDGARVSVAFDLPLEMPISATEPIVLRLYDPAYYYAYSIASLSGSMPKACRAEVLPFQSDSATAALQTQLAALSREQTPEQGNVGRLFADEVRLQCT